MFAQSVAAVTERGLPVHNEIIGEVEADGNGVGNFAPVLLGKDAASHICGSGNWKIEESHDPRDLVNQVLRYVSTREFPEQSPVDEFICVEWL